MKIRIKDNSIRFRLTQSEVAALGLHGNISSITEFADQDLVYSIVTTEKDTDLDASFLNHKIVLRMPIAMVQEWLSTDRVGFAGKSGKISILVEKDFVCIDNTLEDQSDNYPNPNLKC